MAAKRKPLETWSLADLGLSADELHGAALTRVHRSATAGGQAADRADRERRRRRGGDTDRRLAGRTEADLMSNGHRLPRRVRRRPAGAQRARAGRRRSRARRRSRRRGRRARLRSRRRRRRRGTRRAGAARAVVLGDEGDRRSPTHRPRPPRLVTSAHARCSLRRRRTAATWPPRWSGCSACRRSARCARRASTGGTIETRAGDPAGHGRSRPSRAGRWRADSRRSCWCWPTPSPRSRAARAPPM